MPLALKEFMESGIALAEAGLECRRDAHGGFGVFASRSLPSGFALRVPHRFLLDSRAAQSTALGAALLLENQDTKKSMRNTKKQKTNSQKRLPFSAEEMLMVVLAHARKEPDSPFHPYAASLPTKLPGPLSWSAASKAMLDGTDLGAALEGEESDLVALCARLQEGGPGLLGKLGKLGLDDLRWARQMLLSRRFPIDSVQGQGDLDDDLDANDREEAQRAGMLAPVLDLLNHSRAASCTLAHHRRRPAEAGAEPAGKATASMSSVITSGSGSMSGSVGNDHLGVRSDDGESYVELRNPAPLAPGEEAVHNYGADKSNEELLAMYGFAEPDNPADAVALAVAVPGSEPVRCVIGRTGLTAELWQLLLAGGDGDGEAEAAAVATLHAALASKLRMLDATEPRFELALALASSASAADASGGSSAGGGSAAAEAGYIKHYRDGLRQVLTGALAECQDMARMLEAEESEGGGSEEEEGDDSDEGGAESDEDEGDSASDEET